MEKFALRVLARFFFTFDVNVKWGSETFDKINVIVVQSVVVLNMNTEVFRIYDIKPFTN